MIEALSGAVPVDDEVAEIGREAVKHGLYVWAATETHVGIGRQQTTLYDDLFRPHMSVRFMEIHRAALLHDGEIEVTLSRLARCV